MRSAPADALPFPASPVMTDAARLTAADGFYAHMAARRSCRAFAATPVPRAVIEAAIRAAGTAPSGANHQPWHFAVIGSDAAKQRIRDAAEAEERAFYGTGDGAAGKAGEEWLDALAPFGTDAAKPYLAIAPWVIAVFGQRRGGRSPGDDGQNYYVTESVGIACGLLITALHTAGLATLTHTPAPMGFLRDLCGRPASEKPLMLIVVGHPADGATCPAAALQRKPLDAIASWL